MTKKTLIITGITLGLVVIAVMGYKGVFTRKPDAHAGRAQSQAWAQDQDQDQDPAQAQALNVGPDAEISQPPPAAPENPNIPANLIVENASKPPPTREDVNLQPIIALKRLSMEDFVDFNKRGITVSTEDYTKFRKEVNPNHAKVLELAGNAPSMARILTLRIDSNTPKNADTLKICLEEAYQYFHYQLKQWINDGKTELINMNPVLKDDNDALNYAIDLYLIAREKSDEKYCGASKPPKNLALSKPTPEEIEAIVARALSEK